MNIRIRESSHGGYIVEKGIQHEGGVEVGYKPGYTMNAFIVYESAHYDTFEEAKKAASRMQAE